MFIQFGSFGPIFCANEMSAPTFTRRKEDFTCEVCGAQVKGDGYTNHCPQCLWSKHVDINPGDRSASCKGLMEPCAIRSVHGAYTVTHRCTVCGFERNQKCSPHDHFDTLIEIAQRTR